MDPKALNKIWILGLSKVFNFGIDLLDIYNHEKKVKHILSRNKNMAMWSLLKKTDLGPRNEGNKSHLISWVEAWWNLMMWGVFEWAEEEREARGRELHQLRALGDGEGRCEDNDVAYDPNRGWQEQGQWSW